MWPEMDLTHIHGDLLASVSRPGMHPTLVSSRKHFSRSRKGSWAHPVLWKHQLCKLSKSLRGPQSDGPASSARGHSLIPRTHMLEKSTHQKVSLKTKQTKVFTVGSWVGWDTCLMPALKKQSFKFVTSLSRASQGYTVRSCLKHDDTTLLPPLNGCCVWCHDLVPIGTRCRRFLRATWFKDNSSKLFSDCHMHRLNKCIFKINGKNPLYSWA